MTERVNVLCDQVNGLSFIVSKQVFLVDNVMFPTNIFYLLFHLIDFHLQFHSEIELSSNFTHGAFLIIV